MCRWLAYLGDAIPLEDVLTRPDHSLIDQSLLARHLTLAGEPMAAQFRGRNFPTNGDGFGLAWVGRGGALGEFHEITPAWDSRNLRSLAAHLTSPCFLAHVRAAPGGTIAEANCHPFVHDGWMYQHNGEIGAFSRLKRDLTLDIDPELYPFVRGNADSEVCFYLALTYGLRTDPVGAMRRLHARIESARADHGVVEPFRAAICASDGDRLVTMRVSSRPGPGEAGATSTSTSTSPSLFHSQGRTSLHVHGSATAELLPEGAQLVVSEPLELHFSRRTWHEVPDRSIAIFTRDAPPEVHPVDDPA